MPVEDIGVPVLPEAIANASSALFSPLRRWINDYKIVKFDESARATALQEILDLHVNEGWDLSYTQPNYFIFSRERDTGNDDGGAA